MVGVKRGGTTVTITLQQSISKMRLRAASAMLTLAVVVVLGVVATQSAQAQTFTVLYSFSLLPDGSSPPAGLVRDTAGNFYGTTEYGGLPGCGMYGCGTVFKVDTSGTETVLYRFRGGTDGANPDAGLIWDGSGNLYGTTVYGGNDDCNPTSGCGTVFKVDTGGTETVLHSFAGGSTDGCYPTGGLIRDKAGNLYGTTDFCGTSSLGTVFKLDTSGTETLLHSFAGKPDGANPDHASLLMSKNGNLYGVTREGGYYGGGVVYELSKTGKETLLYTFEGECFAYGTLVMDKQNNLYGTTQECGYWNYGAVYKLSKSGEETVLYSFDSNDGAHPLAGVILDAKGNLYGDTYGFPYGWGTVFKLSQSGEMTMLHTFSGSSDGGLPLGVLLRDANGDLYGTASGGGSEDRGTVWKLTP
jgi:uncharacterized repeat protein (TIGR03803 family)